MVDGVELTGRTHSLAGPVRIGRRQRPETAALSHHFLFPDGLVAVAWEALGILS